MAPIDFDLILNPPSPRHPHHRYLSRDERLRVQTLRDAGWKLPEIQQQLGITWNQAQYACSHRLTPQKRSGRPPVLEEEQVDEIELFVISSKTNRLMSYYRLSTIFQPIMGDVASARAIRGALERRGYKRYVARQKPPLSEKNRQLRKQFAEDHKDWSREQWCLILWSDESWVTGGKHRKQWVTRRAHEELNDTCVVVKQRRCRGWMFWGCFNGTTKGPGLFWEKEWGPINSDTYCERIVPIIDGWLRLNPYLSFMQDNAPGHAAAATLAEMQERGIRSIVWPPYSPDLNPIETVWNIMKDYIESKWGPDYIFTYDQLREAVQEAWDMVTEQQLSDLIDTMPKRMQDVIDANGGYTKW